MGLLNGKLIKRISRTSSADVAHSSGYAQSQNGDNFGSAAAANQNFGNRQKIEQNRQTVGRYTQSELAQRVNYRERAKTFDETRASEEARKAILRAKYDQQETERTNGGRFSNYGREASGLDRFEARKGITGFTTGASARQTYQQNASQRQETARRFDAAARPIPKSGGFGRH